MKAKVVLAGAYGVGKTALARRYLRNEFNEEYRTTLGANVDKALVTVEVEGVPVLVVMTLWDIMAEPRLVLRDVYLRGAQGMLAVCDVSNARTVPALHPWMDSVRLVAGNVPVHILLNKADVDVRSAARPALHMGLRRASPCYLTSAKMGENVTEALEDLARRIVEGALVPSTGPFDEIDLAIAIACSDAPRTPEEIARSEWLPKIQVEARLERLRRHRFLRLVALGLDPAGRPVPSYGARGESFRNLLAAGNAWA